MNVNFDQLARAAALQHGQASFIAGVQTARVGNNPWAARPGPAAPATPAAPTSLMQGGRPVSNSMELAARRPSGFHLICLALESNVVLAAMLAMSGRPKLALSADVHAVEVALAKAMGALEVLKRQQTSRPAQVDLSLWCRSPE